MKISILGCGSLGRGLAEGLKETVGSVNLYLTNRNEELREDYSEDFPNVTDDNAYAAGQSDLVCVTVRPQQASELVESITESIDGKTLINFTPTHLDHDYVINVATTPPEDGESRVMTYHNQSAPERDLERFITAFKPIAERFEKCEDHVEELSLMSMAYAHVNAYREELERRGGNPNLQAYLETAIHTRKETATTERGLTETLFSFHDQNMKDYVQREREVLEERLRWMQRD